ncbi:hypothetical protein COO55_33160 [Rhodococcus opacus]|uniref:GMC family oxidoreductase N-terminal domain-containing protein n=1 Tax=Rhodococcus opacus TaxID=37919 RepID=A0AAX3YSC6_RHOOP|nr:GMC family oxidoreductase N-terminal domain-containing protein [Rhodococcus opacus]MCZ4586298.1 GMC family oxidoreductase N-terminal domain-containing protein [Rhodococcus opacus]QZS59588.1 GMC family oxidoreductase N-terminal domain-containing protein [Rhodococcus opacus]RKM76393.1 hypothetical protein COO55_33160 [Rhodococcus opacus]UZG59456.1 GMC family oxidoreductase N-terminal domain-containing protein [Rhodococcus opacus]WLF51049.1 GMC family oxidoreductase N-terminal domain-containin
MSANSVESVRAPRGTVLAKRLSADPRNSVVTLEAGPEDNNIFARMPTAFSTLFRSDVEWNYHTEAQPQRVMPQIELSHPIPV